MARFEEKGSLRRIVSGISVILILIGMLALEFNVGLVNAQATVYINGDGSISPSNAPISSVDNVTYTFTGNMNYPSYYGVVVERNNIIVDGDGYTVQGNGNETVRDFSAGFSLTDTSNVTIENANIEDFVNGIYLSGSNNCIIMGNNATASYDYGIYLDNSSNNAVSGNNVTANGSAGIGVLLSSNNTVSGNKATANQGSGFDLSDSSNNTVNDNCATKSSGGTGIEVFFSSNNIISENNSTANYDGGIVLYNSSNNTVIGNNATANNVDGIYFDSSSNDNTVNGNNATANSQYGIFLFSSSGNVLSGNVMEDNEYNFGVGGVFNGFAASDFMNSVDTSNLVNGKPIYYLMSKSNIMINPDNYPDVGYLAIVNCANMTVQDLAFTSEGQGILLAFTNDSRIANDNATNCDQGIILYSSSNNTVSDNTATANYNGIYLTNSSNNAVSGNNVTANDDYGIDISFSSNNNTISGNNATATGVGVNLSDSSTDIVSQNIATANSFGIEIIGSSNNIVSGNNVTANSYYGIYLYVSDENAIFHNNFVGNSQQVSVDPTSVGNVWDNGYPSGGNFWSDYTGTDLYSGPYQNVTGSDGIGDTPYFVNANNTDQYPLMGMFYEFTTELGGDFQVVSNSTVSWVPTPFPDEVDFNVSVANGATGFCSVQIPIGVMNAIDNVTINGTNVPWRLLQPYTANTTTSYIYFTYSNLTGPVSITPEFPNYLMLAMPMLAMLAMLVTITICKKKHNRLTHGSSEIRNREQQNLSSF